jgi:hypothetical protein
LRTQKAAAQSLGRRLVTSGDSSEFRSDGPEFALYLSLIDRFFCGEPASTRRIKSGGRLRRKML